MSTHYGGTMKCAYCDHNYPPRVVDDNYREVLLHVYEAHSDKWTMVKPRDVWVMKS